MRKNLLISVFLVAIEATSICAHAEAADMPLVVQQTIKGVVSDSDGNPMVGVNIAIKGKSGGTVTDANGAFTIAVEGDDPTIVVSHTGFRTREIAIDGRSALNIVLEEDTQNLEEVMVVAYGTSKRATFTGSATVIDSKQLANTNTANVTQGLQGLSAGVQVVNSSGRPGADANIVIRGLGSLSVTNSPLYVVDGVPSDAPLSAYSPSDIESITVLKDAAATSLYGSRAGNGVILITTKRGKAGIAKVNARMGWSTSEFAVKFPEKVSAAKQWELTWEGLYNDATDFLGMNDEEARAYASERVPSVFWNSTPLTLSDGTTRNFRSGWNMDYPVGLDGKIKEGAERLWEVDLFDEAFSHRLKQDYGVDFSGAMGENNNYYASFSFLDDKGTHFSDNFRRFNGRVALDSKIADWFKVNNSIMYTNNTDKNGGFLTRVFRVLPTEYAPYLWDYETNSYSISPYTGKPQLDEGITNGRAWWPRWSAFGAMTESPVRHTDNLQTVSTVSLDLFDGLSLKSNYSFQLIDYFYNMWKSPEREDQILPEEGFVQRDNSRSYSHTLNNVLAYDKRFADAHHINVLVGQEIYHYATAGSSITRYGLGSPLFTEIALASNEPTGSSFTDTYALASFFGKADYDYGDKYYLSASIRRDGSSRFSPGERWGTFGAVGVGWRIDQEPFMASSADWLQNLKLRASYGEVGNDRLDGYYISQALYSPTSYAGTAGVQLYQFENEDIKWETNIQSNIGLDFTVFDKLTGTVEYFQRKSKDLLFGQPLAPSLGLEEIIRNIGDVQNTGWEAELNFSAFRKPNFDWSISLNATGYKNEITSLPTAEEQFNVGTAIFKWREGGSRYDLYAPDYAGVNPANGHNQWWKYTFDGNGNVTGRELTENYNEVNVDAQRVKQGSTLPDVYGALTNNFRYKDFDLSFMLYYSFGGLVYDYNYGESSVLRENFAVYDILDRRWQQPGDVTDVAKIYTYQTFNAFSNAAYSDKYLFNNDFVRLRNVMFGYNLPKSLVSRWGLGALRLYFRGDNLLTFGKAESRGSDPENGGIEGVIHGDVAVPALRSYQLGLNVSF